MDNVTVKPSQSLRNVVIIKVTHRAIGHIQ
jgi:hypothetical protein